ncbi:MAG: FtsX-like permease family protein [Ekhidna sp.]
MKEESKGPPRWMNRIIEFYCDKDLVEDLQGDLHEYYARNIKKGRLRANFIFLLDVIKFCRPYTIQKPKILGQMTFFNLLGNYFKTSIRSIARNKLFSSINIIGLAVSMSIGVLMITYLSQLFDYDEFHENKERIYKVGTLYTDNDGDVIDLASTSVYIGDILKEDYPGIEDVLTIQGWADKDFTFEDKTLQLEGIYASASFYDFFSFEMVEGDPETALNEPFTVVLTESAARKFFEDESPIGKVFESGEDLYTITGVMKDMPSNTHLRSFEMIESFATRRHKAKNSKGFSSWGNVWNYHVYLLLDENTSPETAEGYLEAIALEENEKRDRYSLTFDLVNLANLIPGTGKSNNIGPSIKWNDINKLLILTGIILITACFNYTNLSVARSLRRVKEVGVRKVVGATRKQVLSQFLFEAILISAIALILSFGLYLMIKPGFIKEVIDSEGVELPFRMNHIFWYISFAIIVGLFAGLLPAMILSKLKAISILKDASRLKLFKGLTLRKVLIVFQFTVSMALIISATIAYRQYEFSINYDLGFRSENVLNINLSDSDLDVEMLKTELAKLPEVLNSSSAIMLPGTQSLYMLDIHYKADSLGIFYNMVDADYLNLHEISYTAGEGFPLERKDSLAYIVIDEKICEKFGFENPEDAIGEVFTNANDGYRLQVSGVLKNYQYADLQNELGPTAFVQNYGRRAYYLNVLVKSDNMIALMDKLEEAWRSVDKVHPFDAEFYDDQLQEAYAEYKTIFRLFTFLSLIAISVSLMGLLGIAVFTTESRTKEISVRKVLGASEKNLVFILSKGFIMMIAISAIIAIPLAYYVFDTYVLVEFRERISIGALELLPGVMLIILVALVTIGGQTLRASKTNPADMLRNE